MPSAVLSCSSANCVPEPSSPLQDAFTQDVRDALRRHRPVQLRATENLHDGRWELDHRTSSDRALPAERAQYLHLAPFVGLFNKSYGQPLKVLPVGERLASWWSCSESWSWWWVSPCVCHVAGLIPARS